MGTKQLKITVNGMAKCLNAHFSVGNCQGVMEMTRFSKSSLQLMIICEFLSHCVIPTQFPCCQFTTIFKKVKIFEL